MVDEARKPSGSQFAFLSFAAAPALAAILLCAIFTVFVDGITEPIATPGAGAEVGIAQRYAEFAPQAGMPALPAISQGRFEWMTFFMTTVAISVTAVLLSIRTLWRNLAPPARWPTLGLAALLSTVWIGTSFTFLYRVTRFLMETTTAIALSHYNAAFAAMAAFCANFTFGLGLLATVFVLLGGASVLQDVSKDNDLSAARLADKSGDLKLMIVSGSILLALMSTYLTAWQRWALAFVPKDAAGKYVSALGAEIESTASGLGLFFGAGYTMVLLALALPTINALSKARAKLEPADASKATMWGQTLFTASELAAIASIASPFIAAVLGTKLGL